MFYAAKDKNTLLGLLEKSNDTTFIIAGGTDLVIQLKNSKHTVYDIIDITKINEFAHINETSEYLQIGALVTMRELCESPLVKTDYKALYQAAYELGSTLIRNRATIGGNICNASQSADCSLVLFSYDARIKILNFEGLEKTVPIHEFILGKEKTILSKKEIVTEILIPKKKRVSAFKKIGARKAVTISKISCALEYIPKNTTLTHVNVYLGAVGIKPIKAHLIESYLENKNINDIRLHDLQTIASNEIENAIPNRSSKFYKKIAVQGLIEDLLKDLQ